MTHCLWTFYLPLETLFLLFSQVWGCPYLQFSWQSWQSEQLPLCPWSCMHMTLLQSRLLPLNLLFPSVRHYTMMAWGIATSSLNVLWRVSKHISNLFLSKLQNIVCFRTSFLPFPVLPVIPVLFPVAFKTLICGSNLWPFSGFPLLSLYPLF